MQVLTNPMQKIRVEKITLNIGVGKPGDDLDKAVKLLEKISGAKAVQTAETMFQLRVFDIVIPSLTAGLAAFVMVNYSLNEDRVAEIKETV